ncbi:hypothetical protein Xhom_05022 [Xenorhabdus hominickii]|uniref:Uncharacterized protein n=1 Tax=Xenorhabdus hominickii TaxID=351679 RepID=A0A2G0PQ81_XENHO|nr:hypothetical protein Xhom_05022 [Xenorhabdus hominickii]
MTLDRFDFPVTLSYRHSADVLESEISGTDTGALSHNL